MDTSDVPPASPSSFAQSQFAPSVIGCVADWVPQDQSAVQDTQPWRRPPPPAHPRNKPEPVEQLVAPIALYLQFTCVAQILARPRFPRTVVEARSVVQAQPDLKGADLGSAVDNDPGTQRQGTGIHFHPSLGIWTRIFPGPHLWPPTTTSDRM